MPGGRVGRPVHAGGVLPAAQSAFSTRTSSTVWPTGSTVDCNTAAGSYTRCSPARRTAAPGSGSAGCPSAPRSACARWRTTRRSGTPTPPGPVGTAAPIPTRAPAARPPPGPGARRWRTAAPHRGRCRRRNPHGVRQGRPAPAGRRAATRNPWGRALSALARPEPGRGRRLGPPPGPRHWQEITSARLTMCRPPIMTPHAVAQGYRPTAATISVGGSTTAGTWAGPQRGLLQEKSIPASPQLGAHLVELPHHPPRPPFGDPVQPPHRRVGPLGERADDRHVKRREATAAMIPAARRMGWNLGLTGDAEIALRPPPCRWARSTLLSSRSSYRSVP